MNTDQQEAEWRAEFDREGETAIRDAMNFRSVPFPEPKRQFAFRWLREQETARRLHEQQTYQYVRWTFWAAIAAVIVGIVGVLVTWLDH